MDYENYMELYEAVYFLDKMNCSADHTVPELIKREKAERLGIHKSIYTAVMRILVVNRLLDYDGTCFVMTSEQTEKYRDILENLIQKDPGKQYPELFNKARKESQFFFDKMSESEDEIYSRCNFPISFQMGNQVVNHVNLGKSKVLELGGNSGGLATALLTKNQDSDYTVVDRKIPCRIGNEFKKLNGLKIRFMEENIFNLELSGEAYDYIILMNLLHDFDDPKCLDILHNCINYCGSETKFLIIEDVLSGEFEPKEVIMHGLRLSVECRGGRQRTFKELESLFSRINYGLEKTIKINNIHTMLVMESREVKDGVGGKVCSGI